jgi:signal transduction histidine kinase
MLIMKRKSPGKRRKPAKAAKPSTYRNNQLVSKYSLHLLAQRLHDGPVQSMAAMAMEADIANRLLSQDPAATAVELGKLKELARRTSRELRHLQFTLRPQSLESAGLSAALEDLAAHDGDLYGDALQIEVDPASEKGLTLVQKEALFHIIADAVSNARKYGLANKIEINLNRAGKKLLVEVRDYGSGYDLEREDNHLGDLGLSLELMRLRARSMGGRLKIDTQSGLGTVVRVTVPVG